MARKAKKPAPKKAPKKRARNRTPRRPPPPAAPAAATPEQPAPPGRPSEYRPQLDAAIAAQLYARGATDLEVADALGISKQTLYNWQQMYPEFLDSTHGAKDAADDRVERSLYERAVGYSFDAVKIFPGGLGGPVIVPYREHVPPDPKAAFSWLRNRRPEKWRDVKELGKETLTTLADLIRQATEGKPAAPPETAES